MKPANDSSSSATEPDAAADAPQHYARLPVIARAYLRGEHRDLLDPLRFLAPGKLPEGDPPNVDRTALARTLAVNNAAYGHPDAERVAEKLADPSTRVVVTGQQPGLFGGPLLTLAKMAAAVRWAERLEEEGQPAVAVFWVATEDHDFREVAQTTLSGRFSDGKSGTRTLDLGEDDLPLMPVGMRSLGDGLDSVLDAARAAYPGDIPGAAWNELARWYRPKARFGEAFCRYMVSLFGARSPLMLDAMDSEVKQLQAPHLRRLIDARADLLEAQAAAHEAVRDRDLPLQVTPQDGASPLFLLRGQARRRILWHGDDQWLLRGADEAPEPIETLLDIVRDNPVVISPGVLARPAIQDALLGTTLQVLGPSEMSYMAQAAAAYRVLGIDAPYTTLRPRTVVIERRQREQMDELCVDLDDLVTTEIARLIADRSGDDPVVPARRQIAEVMAELESAIAALDPTLERPRAKAASMVDRALDQLGGKVAAAVARKHETWLRRLETIHHQTLPDGAPQERVLSVAHFVARYGIGLVSAYLEQLGVDPTRIHRIEPR